MTLTLTLLSIAGALLWLLRAAVAANTLFRMDVDRGQIVTMKGRLPRRLLGDVRDVLAMAPHPTGRLRCYSSQRRPVWQYSGSFSEDHRQRLRNVLGQWSVAQLRQAPRTE